MKTETAKQILTDAGLHKSHWGIRIIEAERRVEATEVDITESIEWVTCACGRVTADIPRCEEGVPHDHQLWGLGLEFASEVGSGEFTNAAKTLIAIENRALEVATIVNADPGDENDGGGE